eukprot:c4355_g1_i1 orf=55-336(-)
MISILSKEKDHLDHDLFGFNNPSTRFVLLRLMTKYFVIAKVLICLHTVLCSIKAQTMCILPQRSLMSHYNLSRDHTCHITIPPFGVQLATLYS